MGLFDFFKKKDKEAAQVTEDERFKDLDINKTYFAPTGRSANGLAGIVKYGEINVGDYFKFADDSQDYIIQITEMYDEEGNPVKEADDGETVSIYAKVNGNAFRGYAILEKIE
jgi:sulfate adenylyltransferase subunit 1 (EFTu-like GTPase family)